MKFATLALALAAAALSAGCANPERSRDTGNPAVPAATLALQVCSNCHGVTGVSASPNFPNLAAQTEAYSVAQLTGFRSHSRRDPAGFEYMWGLSRGLTDEQIQGLAAYYAAQAPIDRRSSGTPSGSGEAIFTSGIADKGVPACTTCHGPKAAGNGPIPRLAGQHADYLMKQLRVFQRTDERPEGSVMKTVAHDLTGQDIEDVAIYLQGLSGS